MDDNQLIRNWHARAADEDYFSKFVFEYLAFIGYLKRVKFTNEDSDSGAIRRLKHDEACRDSYLERVQATPALTEAWQRIKDELDVRPLGEVEGNGWQAQPIHYWTCSHNPQNRREHVCEEQGKIRDLEDWENMVEFWHSIRNNLFHGSKNPQDERDQLLIGNGYKTLNPLVELFLVGPIENR